MVSHNDDDGEDDIDDDDDGGGGGGGGGVGGSDGGSDGGVQRTRMLERYDGSFPGARWFEVTPDQSNAVCPLLVRDTGQDSSQSRFRYGSGEEQKESNTEILEIPSRRPRRVEIKVTPKQNGQLHKPQTYNWHQKLHKTRPYLSNGTYLPIVYLRVNILFIIVIEIVSSVYVSIVLLADLTLTCLASGGGGLGREEDSVIDKVTGHLYLVRSDLDGVKRLSKRDVQGIRESQKVRLDLGRRHGSVEMMLSPGTVWTRDSQALRRFGPGIGDVAVDAQVDIEPGCFLSGLLSDKEGAASISLCNGLRGFVQTSEVEYSIEETPPHARSSNRSDSEFPEVTVTMIRPATHTDQNTDSVDEESDSEDIIDTEDEGIGDPDEEEDEGLEDYDEEFEEREIQRLLEEESDFFNETESSEDLAEQRVSLRGKRGEWRCGICHVYK
ncbi:hypothetical protein PoB_000345500 [Plakobranchus ocellatus]|uniref:Peptidase M12B propeptide domain-containing protein n=1 Tax=Plakobranchus ocellatus TaxID=259542 RepID=A0AAV3Y240_9GAST|nr:hypothetical protein PoB_000345500 [Plakobranchus ocellatus]